MSKISELKRRVCDANQALVKHNLVVLTWGNVSAFDRDSQLMVIKPSGVAYELLTPDNMVVVDLVGRIVEGDLWPSSDSLTHLELYKNFPSIGGVVHTHSTHATSFAQAGKEIDVIGTTQADYFCQAVPCTRDMTEAEISGNYELETGKLIVDTFKSRVINPNFVPACLVKNHAPFVWGADPEDAVKNSVVLEEVAKMNALSFQLASKITIETSLVSKHFLRKHGENAYYGQKEKVGVAQ